MGFPRRLWSERFAPYRTTNMKNPAIPMILAVIGLLAPIARSSGQSEVKPDPACFMAGPALAPSGHGLQVPRAHALSRFAPSLPSQPHSVDRGGGPTNDEACDAPNEPLPIGGTLNWSGSLAGATDMEGLGVNTVWQAFTLAECADVELNWCGSAPLYTADLAFVVTGTCDALGAFIAASPNTSDCGDGNPVTTFLSLNAGTYFVLIADGDGSAGTYNIVASASAAICAPVPPNDQACDAVPQDLAIGGSITATGTLAGALDSEFWGYDNVWEAFTLTECADVTMNWCGSSEPTVGIYTYVYGGECADGINGSYHPYFTGVSCGEADNLLSTVYTLAPGTYYMLIADELGTAANYELEMSAATCQPPPANDLCDGLEPVALPIGDTLTFAGTFIAITETDDFVVGSTMEQQHKPTVWHTFTTTTCSNVTVSYCGTVAPFFGGAWVFLTTACPAGDGDIILGSWDNSTCPSSQPTITYWELPAGTYHLPIAQWYSIFSSYSLEVTSTPCGAPCPAWANISSFVYENISNVNFAGINNSSVAGAGYQDFTAVEGDAVAGQSYPLSIELANGYDLDQVLVWLDSDLDSIFSADELLYTSPLGTGPFTTTVTIPADALPGSARMRLRMHDTDPEHGPNAEPCGAAQYGQVEDYTINLSSSTGLNEPDGSRLQVYPNPSNGDFTVLVDPRSTEATITVMDASGRMVLQQRQRTSNNGTLHVCAARSLVPGVYAVSINDGITLHEHRIVVRA